MKRTNKQRSVIYILLVICSIFLPSSLLSQENAETDSTKVNVNYNKTTDAFANDSLYQQKEALDIGSDRGLFIISPDQKMQLRILGSVRAAFNYSDQEMNSKTKFNPYEIPTDVSNLSPNYFASLSQTRIGFEVTRHTKQRGDVFIRIETDFAGAANSFRIRHAYGKFKHLLVGQTWSLFSTVNYQPATVSVDGAAGSINARTPQIRFYGELPKGFQWAAGIEYSNPDFLIPDSINARLIQVIPDITAQIAYHSDVFSCHLSGIATTISGRDSTEKLKYGFGGGLSFAGQFTIKEKNKIFFSVTYGQAIAHFIAVFSGKHQDASYNPNTQKFALSLSTGSFIGYSRTLRKNLIANISAGVASLGKKDFQADDNFSYGYNALVNVFWEPVDGARIGFEYALGQRFDIGGSEGMVNKASMLLYYDF